MLLMPGLVMPGAAWAGITHERQEIAIRCDDDREFLAEMADDDIVVRLAARTLRLKARPRRSVVALQAPGLP